MAALHANHALSLLLSTVLLLLLVPSEGRRGVDAGTEPFDDPPEEGFFSDFQLKNVSNGIPPDAVKANYGNYYVCHAKISGLTAWGKCKEEDDGTVSAAFVHRRRAVTDVDDVQALVYGDLITNGKQYIWAKKEDQEKGLVQCQPLVKDAYGVINSFKAEELGDWSVGTWRTDGMAWIPFDGWAKEVEDEYYILCVADKYFSRTRMKTSFLGAEFPENGVKANKGLFYVCYTCQVEGESQWGRCEARYEGTVDSFVHKGEQTILDSFQVLMEMGENDKYTYIWVTYSAWASGNAQCQAVIHGDNGPLNVKYIDEWGGWSLGSWRWTDLKAFIPYTSESVDVSSKLADSYILCVTTSPDATMSDPPSPPSDAILELPTPKEIDNVISKHGSEECALNTPAEHVNR